MSNKKKKVQSNEEKIEEIENIVSKEEIGNYKEFLQSENFNDSINEIVKDETETGVEEIEEEKTPIFEEMMLPPFANATAYEEPSTIEKEPTFIEVQPKGERIYKEETVQEKSQRRIKPIVWLFILALLGLLLFSFMKWQNYSQEKKMKASYEETLEKLEIGFQNSFDRNVPIEIEAGDEITYSETEGKLKNIPDFLRGYITSIPGDAEIDVSDIDSSEIGEQEVIIAAKTVDDYGQEVERKEIIKINITDTQEPEVELEASQVAIVGKDLAKLKENVTSIVDPSFGEYFYSTSGENGTWMLDDSELDYDKSGEYPVYVVINDNGNEVRQSFMVQYTVEKTQAQQNEINTQNVETTIDEEKQSNTATETVYQYVDQNGNVYTQEQVDAMRREDKDIYEGTYSENEAKCYASNGYWDGANCAY